MRQLRRNQGPRRERLQGAWSSAQGLRSKKAHVLVPTNLGQSATDRISARRRMAVNHGLLLAAAHNRPSGVEDVLPGHQDRVSALQIPHEAWR